MTFFKKIFLLLSLLIFYTAFSAFSYSNTISNHISDQIFRLHIIANSDSAEDQELKIKLRDALIEYMSSFSDSISSKQDALTFVESHQQDMKQIANKIIEQSGFSYLVTFDIGNFSFPTKTYGDVTFPAGFYDALRVKIGNSSGKNWWCVLFPSLCFVTPSNSILPEDSKQLLQSHLQEEEFLVITADKPEYEIKLKFIELFENAKMLMAKK